MSEFFEPPKPVEPEPRYRMPPWLGAPRGTLPAVVSLERVLARTDQVAVCVSRLAAYPTGFEFDIVTMSADDDRELDPLPFHPPHRFHRGSGAEGLAPEMLRIGVEFANEEPASGPIMTPGGGGGGAGSWRQTFWVWPLPPPGPLVVACEWPALEIPLTRCEVDAQTILDAASRAQVIFSDEHLPELPSDEGGSPAAFAW